MVAVEPTRKLPVWGECFESRVTWNTAEPEPPPTICLSEPSAFFPEDARTAMARCLLDRALLDFVRAERWADGSGNTPLYLPETRWEMVRTARQLLGE